MFGLGVGVDSIGRGLGMAGCLECRVFQGS